MTRGRNEPCERIAYRPGFSLKISCLAVAVELEHVGVVAGGGPKDVKILGENTNRLASPAETDTCLCQVIRSIDVHLEKVLGFLPAAHVSVIRLSHWLLATGYRLQVTVRPA